MIDKLQESARFYADNLEGRKFKLIAGKKGTLLELNIYFGAEHYKHLVGLHKLTDIEISSQNAETLYQEILTGKTTIQDIKKSKKFKKVEDRISCFNKIKDTLNYPDLMLKSYHGYFEKINADYLLSKGGSTSKYLHLFLVDNKEIIVPVTYFPRNDDYYIRNAIKWSVLSIEEITEQKSASREVATTQTATSVGQQQNPAPTNVQKAVDNVTLVEIEPLDVYKNVSGGGVIVKLSGKNPEDAKRQVLLQENEFLLDKYNKVCSVSASAQARFGIPLKNNTIKKLTT